MNLKEKLKNEEMNLSLFLELDEVHTPKQVKPIEKYLTSLDQTVVTLDRLMDQV
jgi:hypothetical protein